MATKPIRRPSAISAAAKSASLSAEPAAPAESETRRQSRKLERRNALVTVLLLLLLASAGFLYLFQLSADSRVSTHFLEIPPVTTQVVSSDGSSHAVDATISVELPADEAGPDRLTVKRVISDTMSKMDYDKITDSGNINYIQDEVMLSLAENFPDYDFSGVYVTELQAGEVRMKPPSAATPSNQREKVFKGLFPSMK
ncbi:MAG: hypothetical protein LBU36_07215 [Clostridiales bacterium]|jgi:hypothetical protein|nr:hypothetical protein [Clostridiales bacterium]